MNFKGKIYPRNVCRLRITQIAAVGLPSQRERWGGIHSSQRAHAAGWN